MKEENWYKILNSLLMVFKSEYALALNIQK